MTAAHLGWVRCAYIKRREGCRAARPVANAHLMTFLSRIAWNTLLRALCVDIPWIFRLFWRLRRPDDASRRWARADKRTRYKGFIYRQYLRTFVFIQLIVCQVFQSVATGLACRAFVILSRFPLWNAAAIFLRVRWYRSFCYRSSPLTHRNFFNHVENVNYLITSEWPR